MDIDSDVAYVLVEFLAKCKSPVNQQDIFEEVPFDKKAVSGVMFSLLSSGFLEKLVDNTGDHKFSITHNITAYHIIKLGEVGLDMTTLSSIVRLSEKQKQAAMVLASQTEKLAEMDGEIRAKRADIVAKNSQTNPLPRDAIVDTLERLAIASELSIKELKETKANAEILKALIDAKEQAKKALLVYQAQLGTSGPEHLGF